MDLKEKVRRLTERQDAVGAIRQRLGIEEMNTLERAKVALLFKQLQCTPALIQALTDMTEKTNANNQL